MKNLPLRSMAALGVLVFGVALFGIATRPVGLLASIWPANAFLLGVMVRDARLRSLPHWIAAFIGFVAADLVTGGELFLTLQLTGANLAGVLAGLAVYCRLSAGNRDLRAPTAMLWLVVAVLAAASAAAALGCWSAPALLHRDVLWGFGYWFATEAANYLVVLPVVLAAPKLSEWTLLAARTSVLAPRGLDYAPALALVGSVLFANLVGGAGAVAIPVPALLWCALRYHLFVTTSLAMLVCGWQMVAAGEALSAIHSDLVWGSISVRLGLAVLAISTITVAIINAERSRLIAALRDALSHDHLTGALSRSAFFEAALDLLTLGRQGSLLMADLDHFKVVNDTHGHSGGDAALQRFVEIVRHELRPHDVIGRLGGEEFGIFLADVAEPEALVIAERLRWAVAQGRITAATGRTFGVTMSIGLAMSSADETFERLLGRADAALYAAKAAGRNAVRSYAQLEERSTGRSSRNRRSELLAGSTGRA